MAATEIFGGTLGELNFAANAAVGFLNPLCAQLDAFLGVTLGPLKADLAAQLSATLGVAANLSLSISDPTLALRVALEAVAALQAALAAGLSLPSIEFGAQLSVSLGAAAALQVKLGLLDLALQAMLKIKIPAIRLAADVAAHLSAGPAILVKFDNATLAGSGGDIAGLFNTGLVLGGGLAPGEGPVIGYLLVSKTPGIGASFEFIFEGP